MVRCVRKNRVAAACVVGLVLAAHLETGRADEQQQAREILERAGVQGGLVVHLGCGDGRLTAALRAGKRYLVHGLDSDASAIQSARLYLKSKGLYGPVSVEHWNEDTLPYADNLVNLIVVSKDEGRVSVEEMRRVLAPRGVALISGAKGQGAGTRNERIEIGGNAWTKIVKPWPDQIDQWTHWLHGPDSNPVARDTVVGPPRRMQWFAKPIWSRSHEKSPSLTGMVSAKGRVFYISDEGPASVGGPLPDKWRLVARDAFNGILLWKRPVPDWGWKAWSPAQPMNLRWGNPRFIHRRLVAVGERVYVTLGYSAPVTALDAATGKTIHVYQGTENTCEILYHQGLLVLSVATKPKTAIESAPPAKILAVEAASGRQLWEAGPFPSLYDLGERGKSDVLKQGRLMIAAGGDHVYCVTEKEILALSLSDGKQAWSAPRPPTVLVSDQAKKNLSKMFTNLGSIMYQDNRVFFAQPHVPKGKKLTNSSLMTLVCLSAPTGEEQWRRVCADWSYTTSLNVYAARGLIWVHADPRQGPFDLLGLDPGTGEVKVEHNLQSILTTRHHHRCYRNKATDNFLLMGKEGVEYVDLENGTIQPHRWLRGMCLYGVMPANGLLYVPPEACSCNPMTLLHGYWSLAPEGGPGVEGPGSAASERLERGPAYGEVRQPGSGTQRPEDWPMYRHDPLRSGATRSTVRPPLGELWKTALGGKLTGPVVAGGRVYLGRRDAPELVALDADRGAVLWRYDTGGVLDTPPTVYRGMVLFGCTDGRVYCLRASDGSLIWRFHAAPHARYVVADDHVESAWPVHGSVMIQHDTAYVTAGRSSFLDGGIRFYMLRPGTGEVLKEKTCFTEQKDQEAFDEGVTSDLLVSDGSALFMRHLHVDPKTLELTRMSWWGFSGPQPAPRDRPNPKRRGLPVSEKRYTYLRSGQGFLDDSLYARTQFHLDGGEYCHHLCFDQQRSYGFQLSTGTGHFVFFTPGEEGYSILCFDRGHKTQKKDRKIWQQKLRLRVHAMVLAGENLLVAGVPDVIDRDDPLASFEGRRGGELRVLSGSDGKQLFELQLDAPPVFDGMAAARGRLYSAMKDGSVVCLKGDQETKRGL